MGRYKGNKGSDTRRSRLYCTSTLAYEEIQEKPELLFSSLFLGRDNEPLYSGVGRRGFPWCFLVNSIVSLAINHEFEESTGCLKSNRLGPFSPMLHHSNVSIR